MKSTLPPRSQWMRCLLAVPIETIHETAQEIANHYVVSHYQRPEAGLSMLQMQEPNKGDRFFLGELPMATAAVTLVDGHGKDHHGAAVMVHHDGSVAVSAAIIDAALAADLPHCESARDLVEKGHNVVLQEAAVRSSLLEETTVDFQLLEAEDDDDDD